MRTVNKKLRYFWWENQETIYLGVSAFILLSVGYTLLLAFYVGVGGR